MASAVYLGPQEVSAGQMPGSPVDLECFHESSRRPHKPAPPAALPASNGGRVGTGFFQRFEGQGFAGRRGR